MAFLSAPGVGYAVPKARESSNLITPAKIAKYLATTKSALAKVKVIAPPKSFAARIADNFLDMARR